MTPRRQRYDVFTNADEVGKSLGIFVGGQWYPIRNARPLVDVPRHGKGMHGDEERRAPTTTENSQ